MTMKMPKIKSCEAMECAYNRSQQCHALAITVGGPDKCPSCDTYLNASKKGGVSDTTGGVGACKLDGCSHNTSFECSAPAVEIGLFRNHVDCATFKAR
jgi:hypothetical protein